MESYHDVGWWVRSSQTNTSKRKLDRTYLSAAQQQPRLEPYQNQDVLLYACPKGILKN